MHFLDSLRGMGTILVAAISLLGVLGLQDSNHRSQRQETSTLAYQRQEAEARATLVIQKYAPALGFGNLLADWTFLQFVQYYGDNDAREVTGYSLNSGYFEQIVRLDPRFYEAHLVLSTATSLFEGRPDVSVKMLGEAIPFQPAGSYGAYYTRTYRAVDQILFLGDISGARRSHLEAAQAALDLPDRKIGAIFAERSRRTAAFLATDPDSQAARVGAWSQILSQATDDETRNRAIREIRSLGGTFQRNPDGSVLILGPQD